MDRPWWGRVENRSYLRVKRRPVWLEPGARCGRETGEARSGKSAGPRSRASQAGAGGLLFVPRVICRPWAVSNQSGLSTQIRHKPWAREVCSLATGGLPALSYSLACREAPLEQKAQPGLRGSWEQHHNWWKCWGDQVRLILRSFLRVFHETEGPSTKVCERRPGGDSEGAWFGGSSGWKEALGCSVIFSRFPAEP